MAEAAAIIGFVASIASLVDLSTKVVSRLHDFTSKSSDFPDLFRSLSTRLPLLTTTLKQIQCQAEGVRLPNDVTEDLKAVIDDTFEQISYVQISLSKVLPSDGTSKPERALKALKSLAKENRVQQALEKIHKNNDFLILYQTTQHVNTGDRILEGLSKISLVASPSPPNEAQPSQATRLFSPLKSTILPWLSHIMVAEAHQRLQTDRCMPTCQWFLQSDEVMAWENTSDSSLLWVHGKHGLDECDLQEREQVVQGLRQLLQRRPRGLKVLVSSRDNDDIVRSFQHDRHLVVNKQANSADLAYYIRIFVGESQLLRGQILPDLQEEVIQSLERNADGM
ncbi:MAG: hypothetical protein Q9225_002324 [Loekoesia sp. 1 TL-2023]